MVSFMIFTASVWKLLDQPMYVRFCLCDFWLLRMLKIMWKGHRLSDTVNIQVHMITIMNSTPEMGSSTILNFGNSGSVCVAIFRDHCQGDGKCVCVSN